MKKAFVLLILFAALLACAGCATSRISEDPVYEALPQIDPEDGVYKEREVTVYFKLKGQELLAPGQSTVTVRPNELMEMAVMRALIQGPAANSPVYEPVIPSGTDVTSISLESGILYVTLSKEFLNVDASLSGQEVAAQRRLSVYAVVDSLLAAGNADSVLILIDLNGTGTGARVQRSMLGFGLDTEAEEQMIEPLKFEPSVIAAEDLLLQAGVEGSHG